MTEAKYIPRCNTGYSQLHTAPSCAIIIFSNLTLLWRPGNKIWLLTHNEKYYLFFFFVLNRVVKIKSSVLKFIQRETLNSASLYPDFAEANVIQNLYLSRFHGWEEGTLLISELFDDYQGM